VSLGRHLSGSARGTSLLRYVAVRFFAALFVLWLIVTASFFLLRSVPGGPLDEMRRLPPSVQANAEQRWGLDRPLGEQYGEALVAAVTFDFGPSFSHGGQFEVRELIAHGLEVSLELGLYATVFALFFGIGGGLFGAARPGGLGDRLSTTLALGGVAVPSIVLAPLLLLAFSTGLGWFPQSGWEGWQSKVLPTISLGLVFAAALSRLTRSAMGEVLSQPHVRAARARGLTERRILWQHGLRLGAGPVLGYLGPALAGVLTGSVIVERLYNIPGVAEHFIAGAQARDYPLVLGVVVLYSTLLLALNLLVDLVHAALDPRLRHE